MNFYLIVILSLTICIPALIGLIRFSRISEVYYPFIIYVWIGALNEILGAILVFTKNSNIINLNIYLLIESLLLLWQFTRWRLLNYKSFWSILLLFALLIFWVSENLIFFSITRYASYFTICYATLFTFLSIGNINRLIVTERKSLFRNPQFIICAAFILYFTLVILSEIFWIYGLTLGTVFSNYVNYISSIINFISIILYTLAIIWMPIKHRFTLPSS